MNTEFDGRYTEYQTNRSRFRKIVRTVYLRSAATRLHGPTLDFGCGVGELLERLSAGSKGVEYNQSSVEHCAGKGLDVRWYDGYADGWRLSTLPLEWRFESMVISHVLEHLEQPLEILRNLLEAADARGIKKVLVIVPGKAGFSIDPTHRSFIDVDVLKSANIESIGWRIEEHRYFPINFRVVGDYFAHHELQAVLVKS